MKQEQWGLGLTAAVALFATSMAACSSMGSMSSMGAATSAFEQMGGMSSVSKLADGLVSSSMKDPRLSALTAGKTPSAATTTKVSDQLCSMLGGGCKAPLSSDQLSAAASKLSPDQTKALTENFTSALNSVSSNPAVRDAVTKAIGSKLGGLGGLL